MDPGLNEAWQLMFDSVDTANDCIRIANGVLSTIRIIPDRMLAGLSPDMLATDLAEYLVHKGGRCFVEGGSVNPPYECFVTTPSDAELAEAMSSRLYCMLVGHRQAGKSSTALAASDILRHAGSSLDVYHTTLFGTVTSTSQLWQQLGKRLHFLNSSRFPLPQHVSSDKMTGFNAEYFFSWFMPQAGRSRVALVTDEAANMGNMEDLNDMQSALRVCRDQRMNGWLLHSLVLVGTEQIVSMVAKANIIGAQLVAPYTVDKKIYPAPFSEAALECLLEQFCSRKMVQLLPSTTKFAADIWQRTVLLERACWVNRSHPAVSLLLDRGFVRAMPVLSTGAELLADAVRGPCSTGGFPDTLLTTAAPLLASLLLSRAAFEIDQSVLQDRPTDQG
ncbi:g4668 [Coccomyxa elongata]